MFRSLQYFSITSLVTIVVAAVLLVALYREVAITGIVRLGEEKNIGHAQTALNSLEDVLIRYLDHARTSKRTSGDPHTLALASELTKVMHGTSVVRIKVLDSRGIVVFSSVPDQIGDNENDNPGYESAIAGKVASKLIYRDGFNPFDRTTGDENLIQTYLPIRQGENTPIRGVFEVYTDVSNLVVQVEHTEVLMVIGAIVIMSLVYFALLFIVRRADRVMETQRQTIYERSRALEHVSAQLLTEQEYVRKRVAIGLHEGLAQSLAAVKIRLENALHVLGSKHSGSELHPLSSALDALEGTIDDVRQLAMQLRPSSLDDLGLLDTIDWYIKQLGQSYPAATLSSAIDVQETDVPAYLKVCIYRIVEEALEYMLRRQREAVISVSLSRLNDRISLVIHDNGLLYRPAGKPDVTDEIALPAARERSLLTGGTFTVESMPWGATKLSASWPLLEGQPRLRVAKN